MSRLVRLMISASVGLVILAVGLAPRPLRAVPEYTPKEQKDCDFCHPGGDIFALNEAGEYYKANHTFEGFPTGDAPAEPAPPEPPKPAGENTPPTTPEPAAPAKPAPTK